MLCPGNVEVGPQRISCSAQNSVDDRFAVLSIRPIICDDQRFAVRRRRVPCSVYPQKLDCSLDYLLVVGVLTLQCNGETGIPPIEGHRYMIFELRAKAFCVGVVSSNDISDTKEHQPSSLSWQYIPVQSALASPVVPIASAEFKSRGFNLI